MNYAGKADWRGLVTRAAPEEISLMLPGAIVGEGYSGNEIKYSLQSKARAIIDRGDNPKRFIRNKNRIQRGYTFQ